MTTPRPMTYGEHAELAASALTRLVAQSPLPVEPGDVELMLRYRDVVVDSLRQRLYDLGSLHNVDRPRRSTGNGAYSDDLIPIELAHVASALPRMQDIDCPSPTDLFAQRSSDVTVDRWRSAALESLAASNALSSDPTTWSLANRDAAWLVIRDLAVDLEAVVILDDQLREVGLLNRHDMPGPPPAIEATRASLAHAARIATWRATTHAADDIAPAVRPDLVTELRDHGPVKLVRTMDDLAAAQNRLADALKPMTSQNSFAGDPHISARTARTVVVGQLLVATVSQAALTLGSDSVQEHQCLWGRQQLLSDIDRQLSYLVDHDPQLRMAGSLVYWQQTEISTSVHRLVRDSEVRALSRAGEAALDEANRNVCRELATSLRRELLRDDSNLRLSDPAKQVGPTRVHRKAPLERALTDLIGISPPSPAQQRICPAVQRAVLQHTVDTTPTATTRQRTSPSTSVRRP